MPYDDDPSCCDREPRSERPCPFVIKKGDTSPALVVSFADAPGLQLPLPVGTTVLFRMAPLNGGTLVVNHAAAITSSTTGQVTYAWQAGDTATEGPFRGEFQFTFPDETVRTLPAATSAKGSFLQIDVVSRADG